MTVHPSMPPLLRRGEGEAGGADWQALVGPGKAHRFVEAALAAFPPKDMTVAGVVTALERYRQNLAVQMRAVGLDEDEAADLGNDYHYLGEILNHLAGRMVA